MHVSSVQQGRRQGLTESLLDALLVVILAAACLAALEETLKHLFLGCGEEQDHGRLADLVMPDMLTYNVTMSQATYVLIKLDCLVHLAGEPIDEEATLAVLPTLALVLLCESSTHGILEELDGDLHRNDLALTNVLADHLTVLGAFAVLLRAKEVTS